MILDCSTIAKSYDAKIKVAVEELKKEGIAPRMCEILATHAQSALSYSATKKKKAAELGIEYEAVHFGQDVYLPKIIARIQELNRDGAVHGILVGMPTFSHIDSEQLIAEIVSHKDIDGLGAQNSYFLYSNQEHKCIAPATAVAAIHVLETHTPLKGKSVAVLGRGRTVGRPLAAMLINRDATVNVCHSRTPASVLKRIIANAEIVVSATGSPGSAPSDLFMPHQIAIDCGIAFVDGRTTGDLNSAELSERGVIVTPVPRGVGLITNSMIFGNLLRAVTLRASEDRTPRTN